MPPAHIPRQAPAQEAPRKKGAEGGGLSYPSQTVQKSDRDLYYEVCDVARKVSLDEEKIQETSAHLGSLLSKHGAGIFNGVNPPEAGKITKVSSLNKEIAELKHTFEKSLPQETFTSAISGSNSPISSSGQTDIRTSSTFGQKFYDDIIGLYSENGDNFCLARDEAAKNLYQVASDMLEKEISWMKSITNTKHRFLYNEDDHWSVNVARYISTRSLFDMLTISSSTLDTIKTVENIYIVASRPLKTGDDYLAKAVNLSGRVIDDEVHRIESVHNTVTEDSNDAIDHAENIVTCLKVANFIGGIPINVYVAARGGAAAPAASAVVAGLYAGLSTLGASAMEESIANHYRPDDQKKSFEEQAVTVLLKTAISATLAATLDFAIGKIIGKVIPSEFMQNFLAKLGQKPAVKFIQKLSNNLLEKAIKRFGSETEKKAIQESAEKSLDNPLQGVTEKEIDDYVEKSLQSILKDEMKNAAKEAAGESAQSGEKSTLGDIADNEIDDFVDNAFQSIIKDNADNATQRVTNEATGEAVNGITQKATENVIEEIADTTTTSAAKRIWNLIDKFASSDEILLKKGLSKIQGFSQLSEGAQKYWVKGIKTFIVLTPNIYNAIRKLSDSQTHDGQEVANDALSAYINAISVWAPLQAGILLNLAVERAGKLINSNFDSDNDGQFDVGSLISDLPDFGLTGIQSIMPSYISVPWAFLMSDDSSESNKEAAEVLDSSSKSYSEVLAPINVLPINNHPESTYESFDYGLFFADKSAQSKDEVSAYYFVQTALFELESASKGLKNESDRKKQRQIRKRIKGNNISSIAQQVEYKGYGYIEQSPQLAAKYFTLSSKLWGLHPSNGEDSWKEDAKKSRADRKLAEAIDSQINNSVSRKLIQRIDDALVLAKACRHENDYSQADEFLDFTEKAFKKIDIEKAVESLTPEYAEVKANALATEAKRLYDLYISYKDKHTDAKKFIHMSASFYKLASKLIMKIDPETGERWRYRASEYEKAD